MKINVDDWHFRPEQSDTLVLDLFLGNGQHAVLEVNPMKNSQVVNGDIPEMIVFCEYPGEKLADGTCPTRWISRPPAKTCAWSNVELPMALIQQIKARLVAQPVQASFPKTAESVRPCV